MKKITFLEVEEQDQIKVREVFPEARIITEILSEEEIIHQCADAEIICPFIYSPLTQRVLENLPHLKLIITRSVGYNHIDLMTARNRGIIVCNVPDYGCHVISEHVFALLLCGIRRVIEGSKRIKKEEIFSFQGLRGIALKGKTLGLIGTGKIGTNVARIASLGFLMDVIASDPFPNEDAARENHFTYVDQEKVWQNADIISLHCPLVPETKYLINSETIGQMKDGVILVNTARGGIIKTEDLVQALKEKKISYAALDVLEHEKNIQKHQELLSMPNVIITPHIAFYADDSMHRMYKEAFASIKRYLNGEKLVHQVLGI